MISPETFFNVATDAGIDFFAGVPDSLLKEFCAYIDAKLPPEKHLITANEGSAIAVGTGHHLATGGLPMIYMQNSGLGNAVNPLLSLADPAVYGIPMVLLIGWRGEPGTKDEPQHIQQGLVTCAMLESIKVPYLILPFDSTGANEALRRAVEQAKSRSGPVALLARKNIFSKSDPQRLSSPSLTPYPVRECAIEIIANTLPPTAVVVATTGHISRELYECRLSHKQDRARDFLTVGSMGHASQIALGIHLASPTTDVVCLDGDGAAVMHLGGMASIGAIGTSNYLHILLNNGAHDSVGGQPTVGFDIAFTEIAKACGYCTVVGPVVSENAIKAALTTALASAGPRFVEIRVRCGARSNLGRPKESPAENKFLLCNTLRPKHR